MTRRPATPEGSADALRRAFDRSFAEAPRRLDAPTEDFLAIRLGGNPHALRLSELKGLFGDKRIVPVPSGLRELMGLAGFRGTILPVYDLGILLGDAPSVAARWLVVTSAKPVAFAFEWFEGLLRLDREAIATTEATRHAHVLEVARTPEARPIVRFASVLEAIERRSLEAQAKKEHRR